MTEHSYSMFEADSKRKELERVRIEKVLAKAVQYWSLFVIAIILCLIVGFVYLRYVTPLYNTRAKVLIKDDKKSGSSEGQLFQDLGISSGPASVDNEVEIMKSRMLMQEVVRQLQLNIRYFYHTSFKQTELYYDAPVKVSLAENNPSTSHTYKLILNADKGFSLSENEKVWKGRLGESLKTSAGELIIEENKESGIKAGEITFSIVPIDIMSDVYLSRLTIEPVSKQVSIINLQIKDNIPQRAENILNSLVSVYLQANIDDKNKISDGTLEFINERLHLVENELNGIEKQIETFKQQNKIIDIKDQSRALLENTIEYNQQLTEQEVQLNIVESIENYVASHNDRIVPSTFLVHDPTLTKMLERYNMLLAQKQNMLIGSTEQNPYVYNINKEIVSLKEDIKNNLASLKKNLIINRNLVRKETGQLSSNIQSVPEKERMFLELSRKQTVMQELYLFLLKKREETAISKSGTIANARILEPARKDGGPFFPNKTKVYLVALAVGLFIPAGWIMVREVFSIRIKAMDDITGITSMPVIGEIGHHKDKEVVVVQKNSKTVLSEQFRALRTNIQFLLTGKNDKVIMLTSSMGGEGKSFLSINLSSALALSGKKVVLMEMDLRKPKVSHHLQIHHKTGFSDYAIGKANLDDILVKTEISDNMYILPSGAIPPNPAELIMLPQTDMLFQLLKERFDYIVIDTSPVGLVTDAQLLGKHADAILYLVRQNYTYKQQVKIADELHKTGKLNNMSIVVNDVKAGTGAYGYKYGYGNGYYAEDDSNPKGLKNIINKLQRRS